ncbi:MAG: hypothetical protein DHS20C02_08240 [Micavibrio sp.]|nr:MAG: hypothetical protein DHS20C02_08240 [Micavibrio sp.]
MIDFSTDLRYARKQMFYLVLFLICLFLSLGVGVLAGLSDIRGMVIPNIYSVVIGAAFLIAFAGLHWGGKTHIFSSFYSHLIAAGLMFVVTVILFATRTIGAADSKLGTVFALWAGLKGFAPFLLFMTLGGGILAVAALILQKKKPFSAPKKGSWVARVQGGESKVPYGVAIVFGAVMAFYQIGYFDLSGLSFFFDNSFNDSFNSGGS